MWTLVKAESDSLLSSGDGHAFGHADSADMPRQQQNRSCDVSNGGTSEHLYTEQANLVQTIFEHTTELYTNTS